MITGHCPSRYWYLRGLDSVLGFHVPDIAIVTYYVYIYIYTSNIPQNDMGSYVGPYSNCIEAFLFEASREVRRSATGAGVSL